MDNEKKKSWEKRLEGEPDELAVDFVESLSVDKRLYKYDIVGSIAHSQMLAEQRLITKEDNGPDPVQWNRHDNRISESYCRGKKNRN